MTETSINLIPELFAEEVYSKVILRTYKSERRIAEIELASRIILDHKDKEMPLREGMLKGNPTHYEFEVSYPTRVVSHKYPFITKINTTPSKGLHLRRNNNTVYEDNEADRSLISDLLDRLFNNTESLNENAIGEKNLIYYTVGNDIGYLQLLERSIQSIVANTPTLNFDFLILTTLEFLPILQKSTLMTLPNVMHHVVNTELYDDGVFVSLNKLKVFSYPNINEYRNILFLDCDVICCKDISSLFHSEDWKPGIFYSMCNPLVDIDSHQSIYHGLQPSDQKLAAMVNHNQLPFNAGQFLVVNSARTRKHFDNIIWLANVWPGDFFFEQCFMNTYFCGYNLTSSKELAKAVSLVTADITKTETKCHRDSDLLLHFIAPPTDAATKLTFIQGYANAHQLRL